MVFAGNVYIYIFLINSDKEKDDKEYDLLISDYIHCLLVFVCRSIVVGVKYGFFSVEHMTISRGCRLSPDLLRFSLVGWVAVEEDPTRIIESIDETLESMNIDTNSFEVGMPTDQSEYMIKNVSNTMSRLKDFRKLF